MMESTKAYELIIWVTTDELIQVTIARHTSFRIEESSDEHHSSGTFSDVLATGMICLSPGSIIDLNPEALLPDDSSWHRYFTPKFDRAFELLLDRTVVLLEIEPDLLGAFARQVMGIKRKARQRETELNLAYAMESATPNQG